MSWTIPASPNKQWFYLNNPRLLGDFTQEDDLLCYVYAQGYTGIFIQGMDGFVTTNVGNLTDPYVFTTSATTKFINFISKAAVKGIEIGVSFNSEAHVQATILFNTIYTSTKFTALVSESEWWNYSFNLPYPDINTGDLSFTSLYKIFETYRLSAHAVGINSLILRAANTKDAGYVYKSGFPIVNINTTSNYFEINGNIDDAGNGHQIILGDSIQVADYPTIGLTTTYTVSNIFSPAFLGDTSKIYVSSTLTPLASPAKILNTFATTNYGQPDILYINGDKSFYLNNLFPVYDPAYSKNILELTNTSSPGDNGLYQILNWLYDPFSNFTTIQIDRPLSNTFQNGTGFINFDVVDDGKSFPPLADISNELGLIIVKFSNSLNPLATQLIDEILFDCFTSPIPYYQIVQPELLKGSIVANTFQGIFGFLLPIGFNIDSIHSGNFFEGKDLSGSVVYPLENPLWAYKYITQDTSSTLPAQTGTPLYAELESDGNILNGFTVNSLSIANGTHMKSLLSALGSKMWIDCPSVTITTVVPGSVQIIASYCDEGFPHNLGFTYIYQWTLINVPVGPTPTLTNDTTLEVTLNYNTEGTYVLKLTITRTDGKFIEQFFNQNVEVNINAIYVEISGATDVCVGSTHTYTAINPIGLAPFMYAWLGNDNPSETLTTSASYTFDTVGTQNVQVTIVDDFGASYIATYPVTVHQFNFTPEIGSTGDPLTNCSGSQIILDTTTLGNGYWNDPVYTNFPSIVIDKAWFDANSPGVPYTFFWTEIDPNGYCNVTSSSITINPPVNLFLQISALVPNVCNAGGNNASIDLSVLNGCPPYTFSWTGPNGFSASTQDISGLENGDYSVTVTDNATVPQSAYLNVTLTTSNPTIDLISLYNLCRPSTNSSLAPGEGGGSITINVTGGSAPYVYTWYKGSTLIANTQNVSGLTEGTYIVHVTDSLGCTTSRRFTIGVAPGIVITGTIIEPTCYTSCNGGITVVATGGNSGYTYSWTNGVTGQNLGSIGKFIQGVCTGSYIVNVTDANGCTASARFTLGANLTPIVFTTQITQLSTTTSGGAIFITSVSGGVPDYTYTWTGPNGYINHKRDITNLAAGEYTVIITDSQGCTSVSRTFIIETECSNLTTSELKVELFKIQCCAGNLAKEYVRYKATGRDDLAQCKLVDLEYLTLAIEALMAITDLPDSCLSCDDIQNILNQVHKICDCDCCKQFGEVVYNVEYNRDTCELDATNTISIAPGTNPTNKELREDNGIELREDNSDELEEL